jgi:hypothetical protein
MQRIIQEANMEVRINQIYSIESDERNFVLKRRILREARDGVGATGDGFNEYFDYTYYWDIEHLFQSLLKKTTQNSGAKTVQELQALWQQTTKEISDCIQSEGLKKLHAFTLAQRAGETTDAEDIPVKAKRGRPKGSTNKADTKPKVTKVRMGK